MVGLGLYAWLRKPEHVITVQTEEVKKRNLTETVVANGKIQPVVYVKISPEVSGEIIELPVEEGQSVKKGELLVKIKPDTYIANRKIAEANYESSKAQQVASEARLLSAEAEFNRISQLYENNLVSESEYITAKTSYEVAKSTYESSKHQTDNALAGLDRAQEDLDKTSIKSPISGTITKLNSEVGERVVGTATYQGTEVMTVANLENMEARVEVSEIDVVLMKTNLKASLEVDAFKDEEFTGYVSEIANTATAGSTQEAVKFEVRIRVNESAAFRPGMSVTAEIETRYRTNVLTVPIQSVTARMPNLIKDEEPSASNKSDNSPEASENPAKTNSSPNTENAKFAGGDDKPSKPVEVVFVVEDEKVKAIPIKRGISDDEYVEILSGLEEGQQVVSGGYKAINRDLQDGMSVKVDNQKKPITTEEMP